MCGSGLNSGLAIQRLPVQTPISYNSDIVEQVGSGVTGGGQGGQSAPPETSDLEIFDDVSGKKRQGKNGKGMKIDKKRWKIRNESRKTF